MKTENPGRLANRYPLDMARSSNAAIHTRHGHWFKRIYQDAGLTGASSHSGRRTLLTNLARRCAQAGASLRDVQRIAGHADLGTTERYVEPSLEAQRRLIALT